MTVPDGSVEFGGPTSATVREVQLDGDEELVHGLTSYVAAVGHPKTVSTICGIERSGYTFSVWFPRGVSVNCPECLAVLDPEDNG